MKCSFSCLVISIALLSTCIATGDVAESKCGHGKFVKTFPEYSCMDCDSYCEIGYCKDKEGCVKCKDGYFSYRNDDYWPKECVPCSLEGCAKCPDNVYDKEPKACIVCAEGYEHDGEGVYCVKVAKPVASVASSRAEKIEEKVYEPIPAPQFEKVDDIKKVEGKSDDKPEPEVASATVEKKNKGGDDDDDDDDDDSQKETEEPIHEEKTDDVHGAVVEKTVEEPIVLTIHKKGVIYYTSADGKIHSDSKNVEIPHLTKKNEEVPAPSHEESTHEVDPHAVKKTTEEGDDDDDDEKKTEEKDDDDDDEKKTEVGGVSVEKQDEEPVHEEEKDDKEVHDKESVKVVRAEAHSRATHNGEPESFAVAKVESKKDVEEDPKPEKSSEKKDCDVGYFYNIKSLTCDECDEDCVAGKCEYAKGCTECKYGYYLYRKDTVYPGKCRKCRINGCLDCSAGSIGISELFCIECGDGHVLSDDKKECIKIAPVVVNKSKVCTLGQFFKTMDQKCVHCDAHCYPGECEDKIGCLKCKPGYYTSQADPFWDVRCLACKIANCEQCKNGVYDHYKQTCAKCKDGYTLCKGNTECSKDH